MCRTRQILRLTITASQLVPGLLGLRVASRVQPVGMWSSRPYRSTWRPLSLIVGGLASAVAFVAATCPVAPWEPHGHGQATWFLVIRGGPGHYTHFLVIPGGRCRPAPPKAESRPRRPGRPGFRPRAQKRCRQSLRACLYKVSVVEPNNYEQGESALRPACARCVYFLRCPCMWPRPKTMGNGSRGPLKGSRDLRFS